MSKELTPLEAWERIISTPTYWIENIPIKDFHTDSCPIVESALKTLEQLQVIIGAEKIKDLPKLALETENACYSACYSLKETEKKLKAFEIIKEKFVIPAYIKNSESVEEYNRDLRQTTFRKDYLKRQLTPEEFNLLKEVLL